MTHRLPLSAALLAGLAACAPQPPGPAPDFTVAGKDYAIFRDADGWRVGQAGDTVPCRADTVDDCYWSLRAYLQAQDTFDEIP